MPRRLRQYSPKFALFFFLAVAAVVAQQDVAVTQQNLMKVSLGKPMYGVLGKILKGDTAYDQADNDQYDRDDLARSALPSPV